MPCKIFKGDVKKFLRAKSCSLQIFIANFHFFSLLAKKNWNFLCVDLKKEPFFPNFVKVMINW